MSIAQATKERPILFSGPLVRAILAGRKTQTRRIIKPQPPVDCVYQVNSAQSAACCYCPKLDPNGDGCGNCWVPPTPRSKDHLLPCPYGQPGDHFWVREKWRVHGVYHNKPTRWVTSHQLDVETDLAFAADEFEGEHKGEYRPSIFMPRWASRLTLRVTGLRVEQLQDITEDDAKTGSASANVRAAAVRTTSAAFCRIAAATFATAPTGE